MAIRLKRLKRWRANLRRCTTSGCRWVFAEFDAVSTAVSISWPLLTATPRSAERRFV